MLVITSAILALAGSAASSLPAVALVEPDPKTMSQAEIRAFNAPLDKNHKFYIRCKRSAPTGSFVQRETSCRTNRQWALAYDRGNQEARALADEMENKSWSTSGR